LSLLSMAVIRRTPCWRVEQTMILTTSLCRRVGAVAERRCNNGSPTTCGRGGTCVGGTVGLLPLDGDGTNDTDGCFGQTTVGHGEGACGFGGSSSRLAGDAKHGRGKDDDGDPEKWEADREGWRWWRMGLLCCQEVPRMKSYVDWSVVAPTRPFHVKTDTGHQ
jgi:hypothetical protein